MRADLVPLELLPKRQSEVLLRIGRSLGKPWARTGEDTSRDRPVPNRILRDAKSRRTEEAPPGEVMVVDGSLELVVNPRGETTVDLYQPSPAYRHWKQLHEAQARCEDLPAAKDLLIAALPPEPEVGKELVAWVRVVLDDIEFKRFSSITYEHVQQIRRGILATTVGDPEAEIRPERLRLARRLGEELEIRLANYHPDMDLWFQICTEPEVHFLMWRDQVVGRCPGANSFEMVNRYPNAVTHEALERWISQMAPGLSQEDLRRLIG